ncbi:glycosyltransferase family 4 protein [Candidatus Omnitrophota bacterium]
MRILLVNNYFYPQGGVETCFFNTIKIYKKNGHDLILFCVDHPNNYSSEFKDFFIPFQESIGKMNLLKRIKSLLQSIYSFRSRNNISRLIRQHRPEIVHIFDIQNNISPSIIDEIKRFKIPIVKTLSSPKMICASNALFNFQTCQICEKCKNKRYYHVLLERCTDGTLSTGLAKALEMFIHHRLLHVFDKIDLLVSPSMFIINKLKEMGFNKRIIFIPHPVDIESFNPQFEPIERSIIYFGRLSKEKGARLLLEAIKGLNVNLKIAGCGPEEQSLREKASRENIKNVSFLGHLKREALQKEIKSSMFSVSPSLCYESFGYSIAESFCLGKTVIASKLGAFNELVSDHETGLLFDPGNINELRNKIEFLSKNQNLCVQLGKNARKWVESHLSEEKYYNQLIDAYESLIGGN